MTFHRTLTLAEVRGRVVTHMEAISEMFKVGHAITVMVRTPGYPERDFILTNDSLDELLAMIERRKADVK